jgi:hypothetical protein
MRALQRAADRRVAQQQPDPQRVASLDDVGAVEGEIAGLDVLCAEDPAERVDRRPAAERPGWAP